MTLNLAHRTGIAISFVCALGVLQTAQATEINHTTSLDGDPNHLYQLFDSIGADSIDTPEEVDAGVIASDEVWNITATNTSALTMIFEIAGNAAVNSFGIYDIYNTSNQVTIFEGSDAAGSVFTGAANSITSFGNTFFVGMDWSNPYAFSTSSFGYFLETVNDLVFFSQSALNDGADHMVTFQGNNEDMVDIPGEFNPGLWTDNEFILAWEDLPSGNWDYDYNDFVVMVESVTPVPLPATLGLFGLGLGMMMRRRQQKA